MPSGNQEASSQQRLRDLDPGRPASGLGTPLTVELCYGGLSSPHRHVKALTCMESTSAASTLVHRACMATPLHARAAQVQAGLAPLSGQGVCTVWSQRFLWPLFRCHLEQLSDLLTVLLLLSLPGMALK